jgi:hypothetical protein
MDHVARAVSPQRPARANQFFIRLSAVVDYRRFLKIVIDRHRDIVATYKAYAAQLKKFEEDVPAQEQAAIVRVSEEEGRIREDLWERVAPTLRLDIESFYIFAKILLDRLADAFAYFFGVRFGGRGSTYTKLAKRFLEIAAQRQFCEPTVRSLHELNDEIQALKRDVADYRTSSIEHVEQPGMVGMAYPLDDSRPPYLIRGPDGIVTSDLEALLTRIDGHIDAMLDLFEVNVERQAR